MTFQRPRRLLTPNTSRALTKTASIQIFLATLWAGLHLSQTGKAKALGMSQRTCGAKVAKALARVLHEQSFRQLDRRDLHRIQCAELVPSPHNIAN